MRPRIPTPLMRAALPLIRAAVLYRRTPLAVARPSCDVLVGTVPRPRGTRVTRGRVGGVPALRVDPPTRVDPAAGAVLYLHGGGYLVGSSRSHRPIATRLALGTELPVLVLDYRLAPEHPFPAPIQDALAAWRALRAGGAPANRIVLAGDSAGGGMCLALALRLRDELGESPRCLALLMPWVDLGPDAAWRDEPPGRDPLLNPHDIAYFADTYVGGASVDPQASPIRGQLAGLPPLIVHTAGDDPLRPDALELIARAKAAGTTVDHADYPGMWHVFHLLAGYLAAGDDAVDALVESILRA